MLINLSLSKGIEIRTCLPASVIYFQQGKLIDLDKSGEFKNRCEIGRRSNAVN